MKHKRESEFIKRARADAVLTQSEVAKALGYSSPQYISNIERGLCNLAPKKMKKFCEITGAFAGDLVHCKLTDEKKYLMGLIK